VQLVFVSTGSPTMAQDFRERLGLKAPVWVDSRRRACAHLGFKRDVFSTLFHPRALRNGLRALESYRELQVG
jgi:peroxiredoxin